MKPRVLFDRAVTQVELLSLLAIERLRTGLVWNPSGRAYRRDPWASYRRLRERDPVHWSGPAGGHVLSRHRDVQAALRDPRCGADERTWKRYRKVSTRLARAGIPDFYEERGGSMLRMDPPDHTRLRALVSKAFTPRAVERVRPRVESLVKELLAPREREGELELVRDLATPLPVIVIAELLGVPAEDRERFRAWSDDVVRTLGDSSIEDFRASERAQGELRAYFAEQAEARRREPRDDLLSALVAAEEGGRHLSQQELLNTCVLLLVAGNETTTNLITCGVLALLEHPEQLARLRAEPALLPNAIEELMRFTSPVQLTSRLVRETFEIDGVEIPRGDQLVLLLASANRDPEVFAEPDRLDLARENAREHLGFGYGIHFCVGAGLARLEAQLAIGALIEHFPKLALAGGPVEWGPNTVLRGPKALPLRF